MKAIYQLSIKVEKINIFEKDDDHYTHPAVQWITEKCLCQSRYIEIVMLEFDRLVEEYKESFKLGDEE